MATDYRALCAELTEHLALLDEPPHELVCRAQEALAQPEPEVVGPTNEELYALWNDCDLGWDEQKGMVVMPHIVDFARAVLARWGHQPAPPAEGDCPACEGVPKPGNQPCAVCGRPAPVPVEVEVAELVARLRRASDGASAMGWEQDSWIIARAAELLEQRHSAPVPMSERLPGAEDCDAEGRCWVHQPHEACPESPAWELMLAKYASPNYGATCWLPAYALPLPSGEVEHG